MAGVTVEWNLVRLAPYLHLARFNSMRFDRASMRCDAIRPSLGVDALRISKDASIPLRFSLSNQFVAQKMDEIIPGLFIGDYPSSQAYNVLQSSGITHVVAAVRHSYVAPANITLLRVEIDDVESTNILSHFDATCTFIRAALSQRKVNGGATGGCLVHCVAGVSRSVTLVAAFLMQEKLARSVSAAIEMIQQKRPVAEPSSSFHHQLLIWGRTACEWNPTKWSEQRRYLMDCMATQVRDGASPAIVLAYYPSPTISPVLSRAQSPTPSTPANEVTDEDAAPGVPARKRMTPRSEESLVDQPEAERLPVERIGSREEVAIVGRRIRCRMCRRELAARSHILDHEQGIGQHAFAPRRRDITVYRAEQERHRAEEQAKDRKEIQERLAAEALSGVPSVSTISPASSAPLRPTTISMSVPVPTIAPPPIIKLATAVVGLRISQPFKPSPARAAVLRPSRPLPTPSNTNSPAPPLLIPSIPLTARTETPASSAAPVEIAAIDGLTTLAPVEAPLLPSHLCSSYYVEPLSWMGETLETGILAGKIVCPNAKCGAKLGSFDWAGLQCSCGAWICPGFALNVSKVDEISPATTAH